MLIEANILSSRQGRVRYLVQSQDFLKILLQKRLRNLAVMLTDYCKTFGKLFYHNNIIVSYDQ